MHRNSPLLGVYTCTQHGCRAEKHTYPACVHIVKQPFPRPLGGGALDKLYLTCRDAEHYQFLLYVAIDVPLIRLVGGKVAENELCATVCV